LWFVLKFRILKNCNGTLFFLILGPARLLRDVANFVVYCDRCVKLFKNQLHFAV
jgi:hypothetical protein